MPVSCNSCSFVRQGTSNACHIGVDRNTLEVTMLKVQAFKGLHTSVIKISSDIRLLGLGARLAHACQHFL